MLTKETIEAWKRHPEEILSRSDAEWEQLCDLALKGLFPEESNVEAQQGNKASASPSGDEPDPPSGGRLPNTSGPAGASAPTRRCVKCQVSWNAPVRACPECGGNGLTKAESLLSCAADLLDGSQASQQYEDQCGYLAEQIRSFLSQP